MKRKPAKPANPAKAASSSRAGKSEIQAIVDDIRKFRDARDWAKFHDPRNLAMNLSVEAAELLEVFLWKNAEAIDPVRFKEELADVFYSAFMLADTYKLDVGRIVREKLKKNAKKYPVRKAKGSSKKYDEL
jgi:NTP pyrophosphatase (non-canonical NTP hydrolase)